MMSCKSIKSSINSFEDLYMINLIKSMSFVSPARFINTLLSCQYISYKSHINLRIFKRFNETHSIKWLKYTVVFLAISCVTAYGSFFLIAISNLSIKK